MANCSSSKDCLYLPHKILIFRSLQELQGVDPHLVDEDSLSGGEEDVEDDWGSIWEEVAEEDGELLRDAAAERFNTSTEALAAGEEILQERGHENVESVEEPDIEEHGKENVEEVEGVEEQFEDSAGGVDIQIEDLVEGVRREKPVKEVDNGKEEMTQADCDQILYGMEEACNENEKFLEEMGDKNSPLIDRDYTDNLTEAVGDNEVEVADENSNLVLDSAVVKVSKNMLVEKVKIGRAKSGTRTRRAVWVGRRRGLRVKGSAASWKVIEAAFESSNVLSVET